MAAVKDVGSILTVQITLLRGSEPAFIDWQGKLNNAITSAAGFVSLEIVVSPSSKSTWIITQRFTTSAQADAWKRDAVYSMLMKELESLTAPGGIAFLPAVTGGSLGYVTEVFVTDVEEEQIAAFKEWSAKIHLEEAKHPGFKGVYLQSPVQNKGKRWITMLQFDTVENLDKWLESTERKNILEEPVPWIKTLEAHRVISPYGGWFASIAKSGTVPPAWKQTMVVLLVLFPIVMLEVKYLSPWTVGLDVSLAMFISNVISVILITYPGMPIAIRALKWWLMPPQGNRTGISILGVVLLLCLYAGLIAIFWHFK